MIANTQPRRFRSPLATVVVALSFFTVVASTASAATRTWVSGTGDDANPCSRTAPCKTFAGAISRTDAGGEIDALDGGGYGAVTITKAITIDGSDVPASILNTFTNGIVINAGTADHVTIRGISIVGGQTVAPCPFAGLSGIRILKAGSVTIEDVQIAQVQNAAVEIAPGLAPVNVLLDRLSIHSSCQFGVNAAPTVGQSASVMIDRTSINGTGTGVRASDGAHIRLADSTVFGNGTGLLPIGSGIIESFAGNRVIGNGIDGTPTSTLGAMDSTTAGPPGPPGPQGAAGSPGRDGTSALRLFLALPASKAVATAGKRTRVKYVSTASAAATLAVTRRGKTVASARSRARAGTNSISWNGRIGKKPAAPGIYRLLLNAQSQDGQAASATASLKVVRRARR